jgi:hypothetical protein
MKRARRMATALVLSAATVSLAAGCGGDSADDTTATEASISKSEFISQADAICKQGNQAINEAFGAIPKGASRDELTAVVSDTVVNESQGMIDQIKALGAPQDDEDQVDAILSAAQEATDSVVADPSQVVDRKAPDPYAETNKLSDEYGLSEC